MLQTTHVAHMQVLNIYVSTLKSFPMFTFTLLLFLLSCISSLDMLMGLTTTANKGSNICFWRLFGLLSVVEYGYVLQLIWELLLRIVGNYLVMGLR